MIDAPRSVRIVSRSVEETLALGEVLGRALAPGDYVALTGDLGAGKTTLTKGMARGTGAEVEVTSPTFALLHEYPGACLLIHVDLYRLSHESELADLDYDLLFQPHAATVIEWATRFEKALPEPVAVVSLRHATPETREILVMFADTGESWVRVRKTLENWEFAV